jgi:hypothetical protein
MRAFVIVVALVGCGEVVQEQRNDPKERGVACTTGTECISGNCVDGVCCNAMCDGTCEACVGAKTGADDGVCMPVKANTDPDAECEASCTAAGAIPATCAGGVAACTTMPTSCGYAVCDAQNVACATSCTDNLSCSATGFCNAAHVCAKRLRVAIEAHPSACTRTQGLPMVKAALEARGHVAAIVDGTMLDTTQELANYDVILTGGLGSCQTDDRAAYDPLLAQWVMDGGGLVASGWLLYLPGPTNFAALMPNEGSSYLSGNQDVTILGPHPIVDGIAPFTVTTTYTPYGGAPKMGSTDLLSAGGFPIAQAWDQGSGRVVFDGLLHLDDFNTYANSPLVDGTNAEALEVLMRSVEWAGGSL